MASARRMKNKQTERLTWDGLAIGLSLACLVHCAGPPLLLALLPAALGMIGMPAWLHLAAFLVAIPSSAFAMRTGYRHHGRALPAMLGMNGLALLGLGLLFGSSFAIETGLTVCGSVLLVVAHVSNWRLRRRGPGELVRFGEGECPCR